jgi:hypothetical protein
MTSRGDIEHVPFIPINLLCNVKYNGEVVGSPTRTSSPAGDSSSNCASTGSLPSVSSRLDEVLILDASLRAAYLAVDQKSVSIMKSNGNMMATEPSAGE